jgi:hypothetical protein
VGLAGELLKMLGRQSRKPNGWFGWIFGRSMSWGYKPLTKRHTASITQKTLRQSPLKEVLQ